MATLGLVGSPVMFGHSIGSAFLSTLAERHRKIQSTIIFTQISVSRLYDMVVHKAISLVQAPDSLYTIYTSYTL